MLVEQPAGEIRDHVRPRRQHSRMCIVVNVASSILRPLINADTFPSRWSQHRGLNNLPNSGEVTANPPRYWGSGRFCIGKLFNPRCSLQLYRPFCKSPPLLQKGLFYASLSTLSDGPGLKGRASIHDEQAGRPEADHRCARRAPHPHLQKSNFPSRFCTAIRATGQDRGWPQASDKPLCVLKRSRRS